MSMGSPFSFLEQVPKKNGIYDSGPDQAPREVEKLYGQVRTAEQRMYSDEEVVNLPVIKDHPHSEEWKKRARSANRVLTYFENQQAGKLLDLGCGNGWFTHSLSLAGKHSVLGLDLNRIELEQAARVFSEPNVMFLYADLYSFPFPEKCFTHITVGAAIQYFPDLGRLLERLFRILAPGGEVHIFDSPFYAPGQVEDARKRSEAYYTNLGFPEMAGHYYHHDYTVLNNFNFKILFHPAKNKIFRAISGARDIPFPWIRITKDVNEKEEDR